MVRLLHFVPIFHDHLILRNIIYSALFPLKKFKISTQKKKQDKNLPLLGLDVDGALVVFLIAPVGFGGSPEPTFFLGAGLASEI